MRTLTRLLPALLLLATLACSPDKPPAPAAVSTPPEVAAAVEALDSEKPESVAAVVALGMKARGALQGLFTATPPDEGRIAAAITVYLQSGGLLPPADLRAVMTGDLPAALRRAAIRAAAGLGASELLPALIALLEDEQEEVAVAAAVALTAFKMPRAVEALVSLLKEDRGARSEAAAEALGKIKGAGQRDAILALLKDPAPAVRRRALLALSGRGLPRTVPAIAPLVEDPDPAVRKMAAAALASIGTGTAFAAMKPLLAADQPLDERREAVALLGSFSPLDARPHVWAALADGDEQTRVTAVSLLRRWDGNPAMVEALIARLKDDSPLVRVTAVEVARVLKRSHGLGRPLLQLAQREADPKVFAAILGLFEEREMKRYAVPALIDALAEAQGDRVAMLDEGLGRLTGANPGDDAASWRRWLDENTEEPQKQEDEGATK